MRLADAPSDVADPRRRIWKWLPRRSICPSDVVARVEPVVRARRERAAAGGIVCVGHHLGTDGGGSGRPAEPERELRGRRDWQGGHAGQRAAAHAEGVHAGGGGVGVAAHDDAARDAAERAEWRERGGRGGHA